MRVANKTLYDNINSNLGRVTETLWKANQVVSTTKRINQISDDPIGLVSVLYLRSSLAGIEQLGRNIQTGRSWLEAGESALTQIQDLLTDTKALCVQMSSATVGASERSSAATVVDGQLRQLLSLANEEVGGRYIFSGSKTDTQPFSLDDENNPTAVFYSGDETPFSIRIGKDLTVEVGHNGENTFGAAGSSLFDLLIRLKGHLVNNNVAGIQQAMGDLDKEMASMRSLISNTGTKILRLDTKAAILGDLKINYTDRKSQIEDADIAEAIMNLKSTELAYQAALASSSKVMGLSLVDYL
jgi:flagellar hook-associated protein 3 FlgL